MFDNWCSGRNFGIYVWLVKTQDYSTNPKSLLIIGLIFASAGIALVSVGASLSSTEPQGFSTSPQTGDSSLVARDDEGVPIEGIRPSDKAEVDCNADLQDHNAYREYAYHAEFEMYGNHIANLSISEAKEILGGLRHVFVPVSFWVLHTSTIKDFDITSKMIHEQMIALNAAYRGVKVIFQLHGIRYIRVSDKDYGGCSTSPMVVDLLHAINATDSVAVVVCNPPDVNGVTRISGDGAHDWSAVANFSLQKEEKYTLGVIFIRLSALKFSMTSLVHQFGHIFGLPHPFPPYQTCKFDGDFIPDTLEVYASSDSCLLENAPLCSPEEESSALLWGVPGEVFMDISPDDCRNKFTPGQILRMRAIMHGMMTSGYDYLVSEETSQNAYKVFARPVMKPFYRALVSKMPGDTILRDQMKDRIDNSDDSQDIEVLQARLASYADVFKYSELIANDQTTDMSTSICFGNEEGRRSWVGFMKKEMLIDGVEITQKFFPERNLLTDHTVEVRVFSKFLQNSSLCTSSFVPIEGLNQRIMCGEPLIGSSIMLTFHISQISPLCISGVSLLSLFSPAIEFEQSIGEAPNLWIDRTESLASQSTTASDLDAVVALVPLEKKSIRTSCSSTSLERLPWWQLEVQRDFIMESITFTTPNDCTGSLLLQKNGLNFDKIATDIGNCLDRNSSFYIDIYVLKNSYQEQDTFKRQDVCAKSISLSPGTFSKISCQDSHEGDTLLIQASDTRSLKSLQLCDMLIQGSRLVPMGDLVSLVSLSVSPKSLTSQFANPIDNNKRTCIIPNESEVNESIWQVDFKVRISLSYIGLVCSFFLSCYFADLCFHV